MCCDSIGKSIVAFEDVTVAAAVGCEVGRTKRRRLESHHRLDVIVAVVVIVVVVVVVVVEDGPSV